MTKGMSTGIEKLVVDALGKCAEDGMTTTEAAKHIGVTYTTARRYEVQHGIKFKPSVSCFGGRYRETKPYTDKDGLLQIAVRISNDAYSKLCQSAKRDDISVGAAARRIIEGSFAETFEEAAE